MEIGMLKLVSPCNLSYWSEFVFLDEYVYSIK